VRLARRLNLAIKGEGSNIMLGLLLTLSACSLPDIDVARKLQRADAAGDGFFSKSDDRVIQDPHAGDSTYLATVRVSFTEAVVQPVIFDVRRDRSDLVSFNVIESEKTSTYLHLGYDHSEGGVAGLRFRWHF
jgi:hypothetical protein